MKKYFLLVLLPFLLLSIKGSSQDSLGISPYTYTISNDTLPAGASDSITFWVINKASTPFSDNVDIYTSVQDSAGFLFHAVDTAYFGTITIAAGDSIPFTLYPYYYIAANRYHYDINVIVIWPVALTVSNPDSLFYVEVITLPNGIDEINIDKLIKAYPNPSLNNFNIENNSKIAIEEVRIYDSKGCLVETTNNPDFICTERWTKGTYLIRVTLKNKQTRTIRVIKQ